MNSLLDRCYRSGSGLICLGVALSVASVVASCGGSNDNLEREVEALATSVATNYEELSGLRSSLLNVQLVATMDVLDTSGMHMLDTNIQQSLAISRNGLPTIRKMRRAVAITTWPEKLRDQAAALLTRLKRMELALKGDDLGALKQASQQAHLAWHTLSEQTWDFLDDVDSAGMAREGQTKNASHDEHHD